MDQNNKRDSSFIPTLIKRVYYPGSGKDLETLKFILSELKYVEDIIFCDYIEHLSQGNLLNIDGWEVLKEINLTPFDFNKEDWADFWFDDNRSTHNAQPNQISSNLYILHNLKTHKIVRFYQLGTEGVGTFNVLSKYGLRPNLIFLADHGFGCNWDPNIWGEPENYSDKVSFLKNMARHNRFIMVDSYSTNPWADYSFKTAIGNTRWKFYVKNK
jgi:hypothetical protein